MSRSLQSMPESSKIKQISSNFFKKATKSTAYRGVQLVLETHRPAQRFCKGGTKFRVAHGRPPGVPKFVLRKSAPLLSTVPCLMPSTLSKREVPLTQVHIPPSQRSRRVCFAAPAPAALVPEATQTLKETPAAHGRQKIEQSETPVSRITFAL